MAFIWKDKGLHKKAIATSEKVTMAILTGLADPRFSISFINFLSLQ